MTPLKITTFDDLTLEQAREIIGSGHTEAETTRWQFYQGEHWQNGDGFVGPLLDANTPGAADMKAEVQRSFIFANVSREIADRHADAVTNRDPRWGTVLERVLDEGESPSPLENALIAERDALMTVWWDTPTRCTYTDVRGHLKTCGVHGLLQQVSRRYVATGRAYLRIFIPPAHIEPNGTLPKKPLNQALNRIFVEHCDAASGAVYVDRQRMQQIGVYGWTEDNQEFAELSYLADDGQTILRRIVAGEEFLGLEDEEGEEETALRPPTPMFDLGGHLLHFEASGEALLSDSLTSQQKDMNRTLTMGGRAMNLAGFPERVLFDVQLDGEYIDDPRNPGKKRFIPHAPTLGAATINNFQGIEYKDGEETRRASPSYQRLDPPGTRIFDEAVAAAAKRMRDEARQSHVEMSSDATASGRSREQARWEFVQSLSGTVAAMNNVGRWLLSTVFALACATSNDSADRFDGMKFDFACRIDPGPISSAERAEDRNQVGARLLSREIAMLRGGVDDVDAESGRIAAEDGGSLSTMEQRARIAQVLAAAGAGVEASALVAGFDAGQAARLGRSDFLNAEG